MKDLLSLIQEEMEAVLNRNIDKNTLKRIKLLQGIYTSVSRNEYINKRSLFYSSVPIFGVQANVDRLVKEYSKRFGCSQAELRIKSSQKGLFEGSVVFVLKNGERVIRKGKYLIPDMEEISSIEHSYETVVVIEKDTVFSKVSNRGYLTVCGKGYPCQNTVDFLLHLQGAVRILCLTDFDPYGLHIYTVYKEKVLNINRAGLKVEDLQRYRVERSACISLNQWDRRMLDKLKRGKYSQELKSEIDFIEGLGLKMELEIIMNQDDFDIFGYF
ncbi:endodeoxyribonuclease [Glugoides intestinalis]